jgi:hypothetical protein
MVGKTDVNDLVCSDLKLGEPAAAKPCDLRACRFIRLSKEISLRQMVLDDKVT